MSTTVRNPLGDSPAAGARKLPAAPLTTVSSRPNHQIHARDPPSPGLAWLRRIAHVDGHEDIVGEAIEQHRDVGPAPTCVPDAVNAAALDRHEADAARALRLRNIEDGEAPAPVAYAPCLRGAD